MNRSRIQGPKAVSHLMKQPGMTRSVAITLSKNMSKLRSIPREIPPVKGAFVKYLMDKGKDKLLSWTLNVKQRIIKELEKLSGSTDSRYESLLEMELFQFDQKGPMSPIAANTVVADVVPTIEKNSRLRPTVQAKTELMKHVSAVALKHQKYMALKSIDLTSINFEIAWRILPSSSTRGIPFLKKGKDVDDLIVKLYGTSLKPVLNQFQLIDELITTPGLRIQGSPKWDQAKVRLINIPSVNYQYMVNGLYQTIKTELIKMPQMAGWLSPQERDKSIVKMWEKADKLGLIPIPLDFRKFDSRMFPEFRAAVSNLLLDVFKPSKDLDVIRTHLTKLYYNQYLCAPTIESTVSFLPVDNLLGSGIANTQADGSTLNYVLQSYLCSVIGFDQPAEFGLTLGDDAVIFIPKKTVEKYGYEGVLEIWQKALDPLNMEIHIKKKYPLPQIIFLQRLYAPDKAIIGEYSLVRNIDSLVWAENYRDKIPGILNHASLETVGQISTLNNSMQGSGDITLKTVAWIVVDEWLKIDDGLRYLAQLSSKTKKPSNALFGYLTRASGGIDAIIHAMKLEQYDHTGLIELLSSNSGESFPILDVIIERALKMPIIPVSLQKIYGLADTEVGKENVNMASEEVIAEATDGA